MIIHLQESLDKYLKALTAAKDAEDWEKAMTIQIAFVEYLLKIIAELLGHPVQQKFYPN